jgi:hypothetical protein
MEPSRSLFHLRVCIAVDSPLDRDYKMCTLCESFDASHRGVCIALDSPLDRDYKMCTLSESITRCAHFLSLLQDVHTF